MCLIECTEGSVPEQAEVNKGVLEYNSSALSEAIDQQYDPGECVLRLYLQSPSEVLRLVASLVIREGDYLIANPSKTL